MTRFAFLVRRSSMFGLALCLSILGPAVLAGIPSALSPGSEEETRCAVAHVSGSLLSTRQRPVAPAGRLDSEGPRFGDGCPSPRHSDARRPVSSLYAMHTRLQV